jgi:aryl-alcohol dehydrogenase-like predicted oxidoreductase
VRYIGLSDVPRGISRAQTIAELRSWNVRARCSSNTRSSAQHRARDVPAAIALGLGITPWSPLGSGMLSGKYRREGTTMRGEGRLQAIQNSGNPGFEKLFTERNWRIVDVLVEVARELEKKPAQVALNWITRRPGVASTIIGATKLEQLDDNLRALDFEIPAPLSARLEEASRPETVHSYLFFEPKMRARINGGASVLAEPPWYRR